jgi:hypothetical protein
MIAVTCNVPHRQHWSNPILLEDFKDPQGWTVLENLEGRNPCYSKGLGTIRFEKDAAQSSKRGLSVSANQPSTHYSNHVAAERQIADVPPARVMTFVVNTRIPLSSYETMQVGPEMGVYYTRVRHKTTTSVAKLQYRAAGAVAAAAAGRSLWSIWMENPRERGTSVWVPIDWSARVTSLPAHTFVHENYTRHLKVTSAPLPVLKPNTWYEAVLEMDFDQNRYTSLVLKEAHVERHSNHTIYNIDLSNVSIAYEQRGWQPAILVTLACENLANDCDKGESRAGNVGGMGPVGNFSATVHYDNIGLYGKSLKNVRGTPHDLGTT